MQIIISNSIIFFWKSNIILENQKYKLLKNNKKISICFIIPARNEQKYLSKTIKSILSQNFKKFVLIINDNSTDATVQISLETFRKAKFSQFKIINGKNSRINGLEKYGL